MDLEIRGVYLDAPLEIRQDGRTLTGSFPYSGVATISDRGRVRKEQFTPDAFTYSLENAEQEINLLAGHVLSQPLASRRAGT